jgi:sugar (pentulose or hexulose) kinase
LIQLRADLFGLPVVIGQNAEASGAGAAALAGVAAGSFASLREASEAVAVSAQRIEPNAHTKNRVQELLQNYGELSVATGESGAGRRED